MTEIRSNRPPTVDGATKPVSAEPDADLEAWQDQETRQAIEEADAGDFATPEEVRRVVRKYVPQG